MSESVGCCRWCASFIFTLGLTALFLWLALRPNKPSFLVTDFNVPALNETARETTNSTVFFGLRFKNNNKDKGVYYDPVNFTLYYGQNRSFAVGNITIPGFRQGRGKKVVKKHNISVNGVPWETASKAVSNGTPAVFTVDLTTAVRYKILVWKTKHHKIKVGGKVEVEKTGLKTKKSGQLKSRASDRVWYRARAEMLILFVLVFLGL